MTANQTDLMMLEQVSAAAGVYFPKPRLMAYYYYLYSDE